MDRSRLENMKKNSKWDHGQKSFTDKQREQGHLMQPKKGTALVEGDEGLQVVHDLT